MLIDELRRQVSSLRDQLCSSEQRCNAVEMQLSERDRQLRHKSDELSITEEQV